MKQIDHTVNRSGPLNRTPLGIVRPCATQELIDGFVRDKWVAAENRDHEVIAIYQGQLRAVRREKARLQDMRDRESYGSQWVNIFRDFHGF